MEAVDAVAIYDDETPLRVVEALRPEVLAKGADWPLDQIVGRAEVEATGGRVVRIPLVPGRSTTAILERIRKP
jgi:D-beta-D-heptose 7-phosphate kinase/D-beta-D-heptose 1-phosphate adenosyltransferase